MIKIRKTEEELSILKDKLDVDRLWSFSRVDQYLTSKYVYYLNYIKKAKKDSEQSIYGIMGGLIHDTIEKYYLNEITKNDLYKQFENFWFLNVDTLDIKFDRTDNEKNNKIKSKYYECLKHFMINHIPIKDDMVTEQFITIKIGKYYFQGYIDSCIKDKDGNFTVLDWKSSTIYSKKDINKKARQLLLYSYGLYQKGVPIDKIKAAWNFLKYVNVEVQQANGKTKIRQIERNKIGEKLQSNVKMWAKKLGYSQDDISEFYKSMILSNSIDSLPDNIKSKFNIKDCYLHVEVSEYAFDQLEKELEDAVDEIVSKTQEYFETFNEKIFWDDEETLKKQEYYFYNLCDYTPNTVKPFKEYLDKINKEKEEKQNGVDLMGYVNDDSSTKEESNEDWLKGLFD